MKMEQQKRTNDCHTIKKNNQYNTKKNKAKKHV